jgi:hypothetical protein
MLPEKKSKVAAAKPPRASTVKRAKKKEVQVDAVVPLRPYMVGIGASAGGGWKHSRR